MSVLLITNKICNEKTLRQLVIPVGFSLEQKLWRSTLNFDLRVLATWAFAAQMPILLRNVSKEEMTKKRCASRCSFLFGVAMQVGWNLKMKSK